MIVPVTGAVDALPDAAAPLEVREYALVEQSADNPTHLGFQQRVPGAISAQRSGWGWGLRKAGAGLAEYNQALNAFGFHLEPSSSAPFGSYTLYHQGVVIQSEIARLWPVSVRTNAEKQDFLLPFVTLTGEKLTASIHGVHPWPGQTSASSADERAAASLNGQLVYAQTHNGRVSVYAGPSLLYDAPEPAVTSAGNDTSSLLTWPASEAGQEAHWGLQLDGRAIVDGEELNQAGGYDEVFGMQVIDDQPFYFFTRGGITQVHYGSQDLPYLYDRVVHGNSGALAVYNPGAAGRVVWFYALRDGLWYYVEIGKFE